MCPSNVLQSACTTQTNKEQARQQIVPSINGRRPSKIFLPHIVSQILGWSTFGMEYYHKTQYKNIKHTEFLKRPEVPAEYDCVACCILILF